MHIKNVMILSCLRVCICCVVLNLSYAGRPAYAAVEYCAATETIRVTDYPADFPCTPRLLARIDQTFGWGVVQMDETSDTVTVAANLIIGWNDGSSTYFQIGTPEYPDETLIVRGEVRVYSNWLKDENRDLIPGRVTQLWMVRQAGLVNSLQLGTPDNPEIRGALLIEKNARGPHRLTIGGFQGVSSVNAGGRLVAHNSLIGSYGEGLMTHVFMGGIEALKLHNTTICGIGGEFGRRMGRGVFVNCLFDDCDIAISGTYQDEVRGTMFENCRLAVSGPSRNPLVLYDCIFRNNDLNWLLRFHPLIAIDCEFDSLDKGRYEKLGDAEVFFISKRHIRVRVLDDEGQPVHNARVEAIPGPGIPVKEQAHDNFHALTDSEGRTPDQVDNGALLLSEILIRMDEQDADKTVQAEYVYTIRAIAGEQVTEINNFTPHRSGEEIIIKFEPRAKPLR